MPSSFIFLLTKLPIFPLVCFSWFGSSHPPAHHVHTASLLYELGTVDQNRIPYTTTPSSCRFTILHLQAVLLGPESHRLIGKPTSAPQKWISGTPLPIRARKLPAFMRPTPNSRYPFQNLGHATYRPYENDHIRLVPSRGGMVRQHTSQMLELRETSRWQNKMIPGRIEQYA